MWPVSISIMRTTIMMFIPHTVTSWSTPLSSIKTHPTTFTNQTVPISTVIDSIVTRIETRYIEFTILRWFEFRALDFYSSSVIVNMYYANVSLLLHTGCTPDHFPLVWHVRTLLPTRRNPFLHTKEAVDARVVPG